MEQKEYMKLPSLLKFRLAKHLASSHRRLYWGPRWRSFKAYPEDEPIKIVCLECGEWFE